MAGASLTDEEREELLRLVEEYLRTPKGYKGMLAWTSVVRYITGLKNKRRQAAFAAQVEEKEERPR